MLLDFLIFQKKSLFLFSLIVFKSFSLDFMMAFRNRNTKFLFLFFDIILQFMYINKTRIPLNLNFQVVIAVLVCSSSCRTSGCIVV